MRLGYTLLGRLGEGSTSDVYEARQDDTRRRVAVKVSRLDVPDPDLIISRMQTEWNVGRGLRHRHLVTILDGGLLPDGRAWLAMEKLEGHDLLDELEGNGPLTAPRAVRIVRQLCEALQVLHRRGAVHRDVKPENVFLSSEARFADHVKLIDLGILALPDDDPERAHEPTGHFIMGTPLYLAPEQARGERPDPRTDLYAIGGVLFHMLTGRPPFLSDDPTAGVAAHVNDPVVRIDSLMPELPKRLVELIHKCLEKPRDSRPASAATVIAELDRCADDLAGHFEVGNSLSRAPLPTPPPPGLVQEWLRLAEQVELLVRMFWSRRVPMALQKAVEDLGMTREILEGARQAAAVARESADVNARQRIEQRQRLMRASRRVARGLERLRQRLSAASAETEAHAKRLDDHDEIYAGVLSGLRAATGRTVAQTKIDRFSNRAREADRLLEERAALEIGLADARSAEREAAEALAQLRAEEIDLHSAIADQDLDEESEGMRHELFAAAASDAQGAAERAFERACIRALDVYTHAQAPTSTTAPPPTGPLPI